MIKNNDVVNVRKISYFEKNNTKYTYITFFYKSSDTDIPCNIVVLREHRGIEIGDDIRIKGIIGIDLKNISIPLSSGKYINSTSCNLFVSSIELVAKNEEENIEEESEELFETSTKPFELNRVDTLPF